MVAFSSIDKCRFDVERVKDDRALYDGIPNGEYALLFGTQRIRKRIFWNLCNIFIDIAHEIQRWTE